jgi:peptide/nickel transport system substrate-binding protein
MIELRISRHFYDLIAVVACLEGVMPRLFSPSYTSKIRRLAGLACLAVFITSCSSPLPLINQGQSTPSAYPTTVPYRTASPMPTLPMPEYFKETKEMAALVREDQIPGLRDRLPLNPKVVRPYEREGVYGGTWRMSVQADSVTAQFIRTVAYEPLVRWTSDWSGIEPNLVESYQVNEQATEYTFHLRRGLRWSDGKLFTTRDIRFWYQDILLNTQLTPVFPAWLKVRGETAKFEFIDDLTFKVRFSTSNYLFLEQLATPEALAITAFPAHYAEKFHMLHASPEQLVDLIDPNRYTSWADMFVKRVGVDPQDIGNFSDPDRPRLSAWVLESAYQPGRVTINWRRNPYYWKVDSEGNQLPYINSVVFSVVSSMDDLVNQTMAGMVDMQDLNVLGFDITSSFKDNPDSPYTLYELKDRSNNVMVINLNMTHEEDSKRTLFLNKDFRIALSYAIDRDEILSLIFNGEGKPWQAAPPEDSPLFDPVFATQYLEYSPEKANEYLDRAGFQKDQLGNRLGPDGSPISFSVEVLDTKPQQIAMLSLVAKHLSEVGINLRPKIDSMDAFLATVLANKHDAAAWDGSSSYLSAVLLGPADYLPINKDSLWAIGWSNWYNKETRDRVKPDDEMLQALAVYDQVKASASTLDQIRLMRRCLGMAQVNFWTIGIAQVPKQYGVVRKTLKNVPAEMPSSWLYPNPAPTNPEQYFIEQ